MIHGTERKFDLNLHQIAQVWNRGSVIRSWLLELAEAMLETQPTLAGVQPYVEDSGEGRWTIMAAIEEDVSLPVISAALFARFASRDPYNLSARFIAALRNQFGGSLLCQQLPQHKRQDAAVAVVIDLDWSIDSKLHRQRAFLTVRSFDLQRDLLSWFD